MASCKGRCKNWIMDPQHQEDDVNSYGEPGSVEQAIYFVLTRYFK